MIEFDKVSLTYEKGVEALLDASFQIEKGEFVFFVGESGAGKTTVVKLLLKEIDPSKGKILVNDKDITTLKRREIPYYRRNIGVVFQDFRLLPNKTVFDNVAFAMEILETDDRVIRRQVPRVLELMGLEAKAASYPEELSGGEQQRVSIARAIVNNPLILLADEPTGNLDPETSEEIMSVLNVINQRGTTVIMATHASRIVDNMNKRVITFKDGSIIRDISKGRYAYEI